MEQRITNTELGKIEDLGAQTAEKFENVGQIKTFILDTEKKYRAEGMSYEDRSRLSILVTRTLITLVEKSDHWNRSEKYTEFKNMIGGLSEDTRAFLRFSLHKENTESRSHWDLDIHDKVSLIRTQLMAIIA